MELFKGCKGYATRANAIAKLAKVLPDYERYRWLIVVTPEGRFMPAVASANTDVCGVLCHQGIGEF